jgi:hypothetical protein
MPSTPRPLGKRGQPSRKSVNFDEDASDAGSDAITDDEDESQKQSYANGRDRRKRNSKASLEALINGHKPAASGNKPASTSLRHTPARRAARKAARAMHDQLDTDGDETPDATDIDQEGEEASDDPTPRPSDGKILTRSRLSTMQSMDSSPLMGKTRRLSTATLTASPDTDSSKRSSIAGARSSDEEDTELVSSSQQSARRRVRSRQLRNRRDSGYNLRRNDSSGFDLDTRLGGIDLTDDDNDVVAMEVASPDEDVEMAEPASEDTKTSGDDSHEDEHEEDEISGKSNLAVLPPCDSLSSCASQMRYWRLRLKLH